VHHSDQDKPTDRRWSGKLEALFWALPWAPVIAVLLLPLSAYTVLIVIFYSMVWPLLLAIWSFALFARLLSMRRSRPQAALGQEPR
jgi:hypothetical protein